LLAFNNYNGGLYAGYQHTEIKCIDWMRNPANMMVIGLKIMKIGVPLPAGRRVIFLCVKIFIENQSIAKVSHKNNFHFLV